MSVRTCRSSGFLTSRTNGRFPPVTGATSASWGAVSDQVSVTVVPVPATEPDVDRPLDGLHTADHAHEQTAAGRGALESG